jgi:AcrR family transcriptional regulator
VNGSPQNAELKTGQCDAASIPTRSDREKEILRCAIEHFAKKGYPDTEVQQIADAVGVGKGTIYRCFPSKEALFLDAARFARDCVIEVVDAATQDAPDPVTHLKRGMRAFLKYFDEHPDVVELLIEERALTRGKRVATFFDKTGSRSECWRGIFQQLIGLGVLREIPVEQIEDAISRYLWGALFVNYFAGSPHLLESQFERIFDIMINGIGKPEQSASQP